MIKFSGIKILLYSFLLSGLLQAQFNKSLDITSYYDDNLFRSPEPTSDLLTDFSIGLNYSPETSNMNYHYNGSWLVYQDNTLRNFNMHNLGFNYFNLFGIENNHNFYFGADWTIRSNGEDYNYYDYNQLYAYTNVRFDFDGLYIKGGYNFRYRSYSNLPELTNFRNTLFVQANKSFETSTTVILEANLGYKSFSGENLFSTTNSSGKGRGRYSGLMSETNILTEIPSLSQAVLLARVTQSLHQKVGIYFQYKQQISLADEKSYSNNDSYYQDEELFDDPFSYESESYSTQLTWILPWTMKIKIGSGLFSKNYISEQAFDSEADTLGLGGIRNDERSNYYFNFSKALVLNKDWLKSLHFNLDYSYIVNESNSYWYDYKNAVFGGGIQWKF